MVSVYLNVFLAGLCLTQFSLDGPCLPQSQLATTQFSGTVENRLFCYSTKVFPPGQCYSNYQTPVLPILPSPAIKKTWKALYSRSCLFGCLMITLATVLMLLRYLLVLLGYFWDTFGILLGYLCLNFCC